jgi:hypothetical protein
VEDGDTGDRFLIYADKGGVRVELHYEGDTLWLSQAQMAELFGVSVPTINEHLKNIYQDQELDESATIRDFRMVCPEGGRQVARTVNIYNLDAIISVGYRVGSK